MPLARFLQLSDVHLGRPFAWLPAARREERRRDQRRALERAVVEAREREVHAILVPGDLFDQEGVDANTLNFALDAFDHPGCPPVFIAPGNHDPYSSASHYYNAALLKARGLGWPGHVHVFDSPAWRAVTLDEPEGVRIWGRCFAAGTAAEERPLAPSALEPVGAEPGLLDVAVVHASREGYCPPGQKVTAPFADAELHASPFAYLALGHYHVRGEVPAEGEQAAGVRAAYAGSTVSLDLTELSAHGALDVRVEYGDGLARASVEFLELDRRRVHDLPVEVTGCTHTEAVERRLRRAFDENQVREADLVTLRLTGRLPLGVRYDPSPELAARCFHLRLDRRALRPDHDLASYRGDGPGATTEERFARALLARLDQEQDGGRRALIESALYYGLDALKLRSVVPCYEELGE